MSYLGIKSLNKKLFFRVQDVAEQTGVTIPSARVLCSRWVSRKLLLRLKNNMYILPEKWENLSLEETFKLANVLQVPSYVSFMTALMYYEITTQVQRDFIESASNKRTRIFEIEKTQLNYYKLRKDLYWGFEKAGNFFVATPEKAFLDCIYLYSFGKYRFDITSIDISKLDKNLISKKLKRFPSRTQTAVRRICGI